jgi:hypothetical protein
MVGTAVASGHYHTAKAAGWHGLATAGQAIPLCWGFISSLVNADMGNVRTSVLAGAEVPCQHSSQEIENIVALVNSTPSAEISYLSPR